MIARTDHVVIVGGGIAGVSTAGALRTGGFDGQVTLVDAGQFPYDRPPLSKQYLSGSVDLKKIALQLPQWYDEWEIQLCNLTTVSALRVGEGLVELDGGRVIRADRVVLATGGRAARPPIPGADSSRVHVLRAAEDALALRDQLIPQTRVLIVGAGLIGAEVASTAVDLGCHVVLADPVSPPLAAGVGEDIASWLHGMHRRRGIDTVQAGVAKFVDVGATIEAQFTGESESRTFDVVLLGVGMVPETTLASEAGLKTDRGIVVDERQVTSNPSILAVGDPARVCKGRDLMARTEHWEAAVNDGKRAAATLLGLEPPAPTAPWFWTDRHGCHVEVVGRMSESETTVFRGEFGSERFSGFGLRDGMVVGAVSVNDTASVRAAKRMVDRELRIDSADLADPATDLRKLLRG